MPLGLLLILGTKPGRGKFTRIYMHKKLFTNNNYAAAHAKSSAIRTTFILGTKPGGKFTRIYA